MAKLRKDTVVRGNLYVEGLLLDRDGKSLLPLNAYNLNYFNATELRSAGFTATELKTAGFTATQLKVAGFTATQLKVAGFTLSELKTAGFTATELADAGFTLSELADAGFTATELKTAGFTATELADAGFTLSELADAGFTATELADTGFNATELKTAGFTLAQIPWAAFANPGNASTAFSIGDEKTITLSTNEVITLQIYDFNHDDLVSGGKAKITFGMKDLMNDVRQMNSTNTNAGGWDACSMRTWLNGDLYNLLPSDVKAVIKPVYKKTANGGSQSGTTVVNSNDKVFLFSLVETGLGEIGVHAGEGYQYPIFTNDASRIKKRNGTNYFWWCRSPLSDSILYFRVVIDDGTSPDNFAANSCGVCFGFCV